MVYNKDGHTVYTKLGNGTETTYTYDKRRERLQEMNLTAAGTSIMHDKYQYDAVDNILGITNAVDPTRGNTNGDKKLGGAFKHSYAYDDLNRLVYASGKAKQASYSMQMTFGRMSEPLTKVQKVDSTKTAQSYDFTYKYEDSNHPTAPTQIGHEHYTYDANGNPTLMENDSLNSERRMYWDEDNRLMVLSDNGKTSRYTYNAASERIVKSHGDLEGVYVNGAPQGMTFHETEDYTIYPAPIITVTKNRFTKHYFVGDKRVASKLGTGKFSNVYGISSNNVTAGQKDYAARMLQIEKQREEYYRKLGTPPGVPTMKGATADPDNTGYGYNTIIGELGDHSVPEGWVQRPKFNDKGDVPEPPIQWQKPEDPDNAQPGYGYAPADTTNIEEIFFYHSDYLGSTSYITDAKANITQFDAYLPYGELLVDEHSSSEEMPYKFNGKEFDQETGLYYYGARYMNPVTSLWYGVDRYAEKYPFASCYSYCLGNPLKFIDINGDSTVIDNSGYIKHYNPNDKDLRVFLNGKSIGQLGGKINANGWFNNLLAENVDEAKSIWNPFTFKKNVQQYGKWDYKYRSPANRSNNLRSHILGIAFYRKDGEKGPGDLGETIFRFNGMNARAEDLNNFHFGVVGKALLFPFTETFMMRMAGDAEMSKWQDDYRAGKRSIPHVPASWRPMTITGYNPSAMGGTPIYELGSPYGDNPTDNRWIRLGFNYYKTRK